MRFIIVSVWRVLLKCVFRWDRLSILLDRLSQYQEQFSYFLQSREGSVLARQVNNSVLERN